MSQGSHVISSPRYRAEDLAGARDNSRRFRSCASEYRLPSSSWVQPKKGPSHSTHSCDGLKCLRLARNKEKKKNKFTGMAETIARTASPPTVDRTDTAGLVSRSRNLMGINDDRDRIGVWSRWIDSHEMQPSSFNPRPRDGEMRLIRTLICYNVIILTDESYLRRRKFRISLVNPL